MTEGAGPTISVYFKTKGDLRRVRQAAKILGVRPTVFMRDAVQAATERVIAKSKKPEKLEGG